LKKPASAASGDEALQNRAPRLADMEAAKRNNSAQFASKFRADAQFCIEALEQLERVATTRGWLRRPGFAAARDAVGRAHTLQARPAAGGAFRCRAGGAWRQACGGAG
jgi:type VI secretion system protein ImpA